MNKITSVIVPEIKPTLQYATISAYNLESGESSQWKVDIAMPRKRYTVVYSERRNLIEVLTALSTDGWSCVSIDGPGFAYIVRKFPTEGVV